LPVSGAQKQNEDMYRYAALAAGCFFTTFGLLGLIPPLHENWPSDEPMMAVRNGRGFLFGIFPNNLALALVHLGVGAWGLFAYRTYGSSLLFVRLSGALFGVLAICGLLPTVNSLAGVVPTFGNTATVHIVTATLLIAVLVVGKRQPPPEETDGPEPALGAGAVSVASIAGIPVHVFLASFPLAFLLAAVATDLAHWWTMLDWYVDYGGFWATASVWLIGAGLGGALLASVSGLVDVWAIRENRRQQLLSLHILGSVGVLLLGAVNLAIRITDHEASVIPWGIVLSVLTSVLLVYSGWFAGHLIHRRVVSTVGSNTDCDSIVQPESASVSIASETASRPPATGRQGRRTSSWD
jgi:uncharacterized membrane protein